ncbi:MAG: endolytic transglycosylase MltG [Tissierellia bacterium]|nr:endolytic transglycosylase MltG [Tissierellia bacterium]
MKDFIEKLKDIIYDGIDYIIMALVIAAVVLVINWRLGGLFAKDATDIIADNTHEIIEENNDNDDIDESSTNGEQVLEKDSETAQDEETDENQKDDINKEEEVVHINIPPGSLPAKIGDILVESGLIQDRNEFVNKVVELRMETRLKSGEYEIAKNSSLEEIIQVLTK